MTRLLLLLSTAILIVYSTGGPLGGVPEAIVAGNSVIPNQIGNQVHLPSVIAPVAQATATSTPPVAVTVTPAPTPTATPITPCTPSPLEVSAVDIRLNRFELPSEYDAAPEGDPSWPVDGVRLSSHAATEFTGDFRYGPARIWDEVAVYCSASMAVESWSGMLDAVTDQYPTRQEHQLEIGEQTYAFSRADRGSILYGLLFRQDNVIVLIYITGFEDVIDLETIENLGDIIEAKLE